MAGLSSNTLFHFTKTMGQLTSILTHGFWPSFSLEQFSVVFHESVEFQLAVPMVSFCDIRLSQSTSHMSTYGRYGLGMTKKWGMKHGITPVLYFHESSPNAKTISAFFDRARNSDLKDPALQGVIRLITFTKLYRGLPLNKKGTSRDVNFYDEREWRYSVPDEDGIVPLLSKEDWDNPERRAISNEAMRRNKLTFESEDIRFIIVAEDREIVPMMSNIRSSNKYSPNSLKRLCSRIITAESIDSDF